MKKYIWKVAVILVFGKMIRFMRFKRNLKQTELANKVGIASSTLAHYESEYRTITFEIFKQIADSCEFEIIFKDKKDNSIYHLEDMKRMTYDSRVRNDK